MRKALILGVAAAVLGGCVTGKVVQTFDAPASAKAAVRAYLRDSLKDPYSLRDAEISNAYRTEEGIRRLGAKDYLAVCAKFNGKNSFGAYTGKKLWGFIVYEGTVAQGVEGAYFCADPARVQAWQPFPEIENMR